MALVLVLSLVLGFQPKTLAHEPPGQGQTATKGIEGDWQGTLKVSGTEMRLALHIAINNSDGYKATMDSLDQGTNGIPITSMSFKDSKMKFTVDSIQGSYEGTADNAGAAISGTWVQSGQPFPLDFKRATSPIKTEHKPAEPSDIDGAWLGTVEVGAAKLRIVFHVANTEDGLTATMDSLDQDVKGIPATEVKRDGDSLTIEMKQLGGIFKGTINKDRTAIEGTWTQGGATRPFAMQRVKDAAELKVRRPQNPNPPLPYGYQEASFENKQAGVKLAGTFTAPPSQGPFPAVVLIAGSGPHDRDESILGHRPFLIISDYLTRHGVVVLRYDKRGVEQSSGDYATATTSDFASDAEAAFKYLRTLPGVDPRRAGLIGHSEGAIIAPIVAARNPDVAFIVMMAGSGVPGDQVLAEQKTLISEAAGMSPQKAEKEGDEEREILSMVKAESDDAALEKAVAQRLAGKTPEAQLGTQVKMLSSPWFRYFISYDPATALRKVTCPVLVLSGERDLQVPPRQNLPAIGKALEAAGNRHFQIDELPGLNHLFQPAKTGSPAEYGAVETTISPVVLEEISDWILKQ